MLPLSVMQVLVEDRRRRLLADARVTRLRKEERPAGSALAGLRQWSPLSRAFAIVRRADPRLARRDPRTSPGTT
jgi:hypothetical protein